jgi:hypothetical protein
MARRCCFIHDHSVFVTFVSLHPLLFGCATCTTSLARTAALSADDGSGDP